MWKPAKGRAIDQLDSCRILTAQAGILSQSRTCEIYGGQKSRETRFSVSSSLFVCHYHSTYALYILSTCFFCQADKRAKPGNFYNRNVPSEIWYHSIENYLHLFGACITQSVRLGYGLDARGKVV